MKGEGMDQSDTIHPNLDVQGGQDAEDLDQAEQTPGTPREADEDAPRAAPESARASEDLRSSIDDEVPSPMMASGAGAGLTARASLGAEGLGQLVNPGDDSNRPEPSIPGAGVGKASRTEDHDLEPLALGGIDQMVSALIDADANLDRRLDDIGAQLDRQVALLGRLRDEILKRVDALERHACVRSRTALRRGNG